jgi:isopenicillin N synthase-like dioxygenase
LRQGTENHGYVRPGQEKFNGKTKDLRHAYNICQIAKLPDEPGFKEDIEELARDFKNLSRLLLQALSVGLELPSDYFTTKHSHMLDGENENETTFRLLYYPPLIIDDDKTEIMKGCSTYCHQKTEFDEKTLGKLNIKDDVDEEHILQKDVINKTVTRCTAHCDYGTFTLLAQDAEGGLEVQLPGTEKWQRVGHLPGAIFINTGELLSIWTQGKYPALVNDIKKFQICKIVTLYLLQPHRVVIPEESYVRSKGRHSIAFFVHPGEKFKYIPNS